jgi:c-di-GMP-binding flagellar brake protein YcgR
MTPADTQTLRDAVARSGPAVLSLPSAGMLRHHRTRFLIPEDADGFWIEAPAGERPLIDELRAANQPVGVSLRPGGSANKVIFTTLIREYETALPVNELTAVDALLLAWPDQVQAIQRRADYRVTVQPADADLRLRVWRIPEHHHLRDRPPASALLKVALRDLSAGGMGLTYSPAPDAPKLADDQRLRITLAYGSPAAPADADEFILEGRVRHARPLPGDNYRLGVQFKKLEDDLPGRQALATLTHIVGQLQRTEIRRKRIALARKTA